MNRGKRLFAVLLFLAMAVTMIPVFTVPAGATEVPTVVVDTGPELKAALEAVGDYDIMVHSDIDYKENGEYSSWCTVGGGSKYMVLNGHSITIHNDDARYSCLFSIPADAELVVYDTDKQTDNYVTYNGYINEDGDTKIRTLFAVSGRLVINSGKYVAGRSKTDYQTRGGGNVGYFTLQTVGSGVVVGYGGTFMMNGGELAARGEGYGAVEVYTDATVYINDGTLVGQGGAKCICKRNASEFIYIASGILKTTENPHDTIVDGVVRSISAGSIGTASQDYATGAIKKGSNPRTVTPGMGKCELIAKSGTITLDTNRNMVFHLLDSDPVMMIDPNTEDAQDYFRGFHDSIWDVYPETDHYRQYKWQVLTADKKVLAETGYVRDQSSINVKTGFSGFTPTPGEVYIIRCTSVEQLKEGVSHTCRSVDTFFELQEGGASTEPIPEGSSYVTVSAGTANKSSAKAGETVSLTAIPGGSDFTFDSWDPVAGGMSVKSLGSSSTTFTMPGNDVKISAKYKIKGSAASNPWSGKTNPFVDVIKGTYYYDPVLWAYYASPQVTNGMDASHFGPTRTVTRGQCVTFLWRAMGCPEPTTKKNPFVDVPESQYYYKPILWAVEKGITKGTDANHFSPDQTLSTAHIATFLFRTLGKGTDGWYEAAGNWAYQDGLLVGTSLQDVHPDVDCPRSAVVTFLYRELADAAPGVNELSKNDFLMYVEEYFNITSRGRVVTGKVLNGSIRTGDKVTLISYDESTKAPVRTTYTVEGIEMFRKMVDEARKGDNAGILLSTDTSIKTPKGSALVNQGSSLKSTPGRFVGTVKLNDQRRSPLYKGATFQVYWAGYDVTAMLVDLNGAELQPNTTRECVSLTLLYPELFYIGQELTIREGGRTYGTFTITGIE